MDSVTQMVLGSAVSVAVMGRRVPVWKSALVGAMAGTLPDLDVVIDYGDPISNMIYHRAETHALFWMTLISPLLAWLAATLSRSREQFRIWWLAVWLVLITHTLLDALTIYGTRLFLPFSNYPVGLGSIFIIDPLYTLPLLVGVTLALIWRRRRGLNANRNGLILSTLYLCWGVMAQQHVAAVADQALSEQGVSVQQRLVVPTPLNSLVWRVLVMTPEHYGEGFYSLVDGDAGIRFHWFDRGADLYQDIADQVLVQQLDRFSHSYVRVMEQDGEIRMADLRMGQQPYYFFDFTVAARHDEGVTALPPRQHRQREDWRRGIDWLVRRSRDASVAPLHLQDSGLLR
jgi:inner membrane protein